MLSRAGPIRLHKGFSIKFKQFKEAKLKFMYIESPGIVADYEWALLQIYCEPEYFRF